MFTEALECLIQLYCRASVVVPLAKTMQNLHFIFFVFQDFECLGQRAETCIILTFLLASE